MGLEPATYAYEAVTQSILPPPNPTETEQKSDIFASIYNLPYLYLK